MAGETKTAIVGAIAAIGCAVISGYFTVKASRSSEDAKTASSQVATTSSQVAAGAVSEGYDTTVKPFFDQTRDLTDALQARMDLMQSQIHALTQEISAAQHVAGAPSAPPAPPLPKKLVVPGGVRFRSEALMKFQQKGLPQ